MEQSYISNEEIPSLLQEEEEEEGGGPNPHSLNCLRRRTTYCVFRREAETLLGLLCPAYFITVALLSASCFSELLFLGAKRPLQIALFVRPYVRLSDLIVSSTNKNCLYITYLYQIFKYVLSMYVYSMYIVLKVFSRYIIMKGALYDLKHQTNHLLTFWCLKYSHAIHIFISISDLFTHSLT